MRAAIALGVGTTWLVLLFAPPARAVLIEVLPPAQVVAEGDTVDVRLAISGLGDHSAPSLAAFDVDVGFDPAVLGFVSASFGDPVLGDQLDLLGLGSHTEIIPGVGTVNLLQLSFDVTDDLDTLQAGAFVVATLTFDAVARGSSTLALNLNTVGDPEGQPLATEVESATVRVTPGGVPVPGPSAGVLLACSVIALAVRRMRRLSC